MKRKKGHVQIASKPHHSQELVQTQWKFKEKSFRSKQQWGKTAFMKKMNQQRERKATGGDFGGRFLQLGKGADLEGSRGVIRDSRNHEGDVFSEV